MDKKRVLVTGANGYIGRHVVKALLDKGCDVIASDFYFDGVDERARKCSIPIFDNDDFLYDKVGRPDVCVHLAWRNGFQHNNTSHINDLPKHYDFVSKMYAAGLKQMVSMGTMHEVGYWEGAIDENTPTNPISLYGIAKNALRELSYFEAQKNNAILQWVRAYYILGDDCKNNSIFTKLIQAEKDGREKFPFTSGKNKYDFIQVKDLAYQIASVANQTEVTGTINCCTGKPVALADQVESFIKEHNFKIKLEYGAFPDRPYDSPEVWGDPTKINKILGVNS